MVSRRSIKAASSACWDLGGGCGSISPPMIRPNPPGPVATIDPSLRTAGHTTAATAGAAGPGRARMSSGRGGVGETALVARFDQPAETVGHRPGRIGGHGGVGGVVLAAADP